MRDAPHLYDDVGKFNVRFGLPVADGTVAPDADGADVRGPRLLDPDEFMYRLRFLQEELIEFTTAHARGNLVDAADALADLAYVVLGTAHYMGLPFDAVWREVHVANMRKVRTLEGGSHRRGEREYLRKPAGWVGPDVSRALADAGWQP